MFEKLEFPRQGVEDQAAIVLRRSEYNDESQYIDGEEQGEKGNAVNVPEEKPVDDSIELYPGDMIKIKKSLIPECNGMFITIKNQVKNHKNIYLCHENKYLWHIDRLDVSTLIRAGEQKQQSAIEPQVGDIVEWEGSQDKYAILITGFFNDHFKSGISHYGKNRIKRILYRLGEDYIEKAPGIGVNK